jgi:hypothetical protein
MLFGPLNTDKQLLLRSDGWLRPEVPVGLPAPTICSIAAPKPAQNVQAEPQQHRGAWESIESGRGSVGTSVVALESA